MTQSTEQEAISLLNSFYLRRMNIFDNLQQVIDHEPTKTKVDLTDGETIQTTRFMQVIIEAMNKIKEDTWRRRKTPGFPMYIYLFDLVQAIEINVVNPQHIVTNRAIMIGIKHAKQLLSKQEYSLALTNAAHQLSQEAYDEASALLSREDAENHSRGASHPEKTKRSSRRCSLWKAICLERILCTDE